MNSFMNILDSDGTYTYMPFNEFTTTELGLERGGNLCPIVIGVPNFPQTDFS